MDKIIRIETKLNKKEYNDIDMAFKYLKKGKFPLKTIYKELKLKNGKDSDLRLTIKQSYGLIFISIILLEKVVFFKKCLSIRDVLGVHRTMRINGDTFLINVNIECTNIIKYCKEKLSILEFKLDNEEERGMYVQIMYNDFSDEDELLIATYCLFLLVSHDYKLSNSYSFDLYKKKLNYIGYDIKDFYNKDIKYSLDELEKVKKEINSSKGILFYLIGLVNYMKDDVTIGQDLYKVAVFDIFFKYFLLKVDYFRKLFVKSKLSQRNKK